MSSDSSPSQNEGYEYFRRRMDQAGVGPMDDETVALYLSSWAAGGLIGEAIKEQYGSPYMIDYYGTKGENFVSSLIQNMMQGFTYARTQAARSADFGWEY